ncbi:MAG TPA: serine/threonine-protein kinase [Candidatus Limnocylindria bacterium]|nr:serine/threonine-protein kinase [Candidatus Limnocylindria bacterium]
MADAVAKQPDPATKPAKQPKPGWSFVQGDEIAPGRTMQALLGGGERYEAYVAWNHRLMEPTLLKVLRPHLVGDERARRSLHKEGTLLGHLQHPGLTRLFGMDAEGERPFIEIEYVEGPRLSTLVRRHGRLNPEQAFPLGRQLAATLHYLHAEGILHLDVKPSNVVMGPVPRLIDLSVARRVDSVGRINGYVGTDAYMAPEQADPGLWPTIGPKTDTWGLGATLYYGVAKRIPHSKGVRGSTGAERFPQLVESPAPLEPLRHSPGLVELIMAALSRDPAARPSTEVLFDRFDELAAVAGVGKVRFR